MSGAHDSGKGDASRVIDIRKYTERNDEINWPGRRHKRDMEARERLGARLKGRKVSSCPESEFMPCLDEWGDIHNV